MGGPCGGARLHAGEADEPAYCPAGGHGPRYADHSMAWAAGRFVHPPGAVVTALLQLRRSAQRVPVLSMAAIFVSWAS